MFGGRRKIVLGTLSAAACGLAVLGIGYLVRWQGASPEDRCAVASGKRFYTKDGRIVLIGEDGKAGTPPWTSAGSSGRVVAQAYSPAGRFAAVLVADPARGTLVRVYGTDARLVREVSVASEDCVGEVAAGDSGMCVFGLRMRVGDWFALSLSEWHPGDPKPRPMLPMPQSPVGVVDNTGRLAYLKLTGEFLQAFVVSENGWIAFHGQADGVSVLSAFDEAKLLWRVEIPVQGTAGRPNVAARGGSDSILVRTAQGDLYYSFDGTEMKKSK